MAITKEEAGKALFDLATGTSSPDFQVERVLAYFDLIAPMDPVAPQFRRAVMTVVQGIREIVLMRMIQEGKQG